MDTRNIAEIDDGGPAFPRPLSRDPEHYHRPEIYSAQEGLSLRDYFAAKALQGLLSDAWMKADNSTIRSFADEAYNWADAMIQARKAVQS